MTDQEGIRQASGLFDVSRFGASGDGRHLDTTAIQTAIDACSANRGGTVLLAPGTYLSGTLFLKNNVTLHLEPAATLLGSTNLQDYSPKVARCGFTKEYHLDKCLIYAGNVQNVGITGRGMVDGQGAAFKGAAEGPEGGERPMLIRFFDSKNILLDGVTLQNAAAWCAHFRESSDVRVTGITIDNRKNWNSDGIDLMGTRDVRISDCSITCLDDAICFQNLSHEKPVENVVITNCIISTRWAAIRSGGAHRAGIRNVTVSNCVVRNAYGCGVKLQVSGNGSLENMTFSNIVMRAVSCPISLRFGNAHYHNDKRDESFPWGAMRNLMFDNIWASIVDEATLRREVKFPGLYPGEERQCMSICGIPGHPIEGITLSNLCLSFPGGGTKEDAANLIPPELADQYPEYFMWGVLPAYGLYARHAKALTMNNVRFELRNADARPPMVCEDVADLEIAGFRADLCPEVGALLRTRNARPLILQNCRGLQEQGATTTLVTEF
jgi:hypothetical protein